MSKEIWVVRCENESPSSVGSSERQAWAKADFWMLAGSRPLDDVIQEMKLQGYRAERMYTLQEAAEYLHLRTLGEIQNDMAEEPAEMGDDVYLDMLAFLIGKARHGEDV